MREPPRSAQFDDVYFSAHDGAEETKHVFLDGNNLPGRWQGKDRFTIAETGFGTGLNFLMAWELFDKTADEGAFLDFVSIEKYPLSANEIRDGLSGWAERLSPYLDKMLAQYPMRVPGFHRMVFDGRVALTLIFDDVITALPEVMAHVDAWFLDGFSPAKNPDMWSEDVFSNMARLSHAGTTFSTFTSAGFVKRGLMEAGFSVEKKKGFAKKREMLTGAFASDKKRPVYSRQKKVLIHGAGLAGCSAAYALRQYGFESVIYDPSGIANGASGNSLGLINPRFTAFRTPESDFYTAGFAQTVRIFQMMDNIDYNRCGSIHLVNDEDKQKRFSRTNQNWGWHEDHMKYVSADEATDVAGISISTDALYLPDSGQVNVAKLCHTYAKDIPILSSLPEDQNDYVHIYALGAGFTKDPRFDHLPIHTVRGQITEILATEQSQKIKTNICYGGYLSCVRNGHHVVGSTFQKWLSHTDILPEDDTDNLAKLSAQIPSLTGFSVVGGRASLRVASKDRFPVVGELGPEGLVCLAHGSHGIVSSIASAHLMADILRTGVRSLGKSTVKNLSPQRFLGS